MDEKFEKLFAMIDRDESRFQDKWRLTGRGRDPEGGNKKSDLKHIYQVEEMVIHTFDGWKNRRGSAREINESERSSAKIEESRCGSRKMSDLERRRLGILKLDSNNFPQIQNLCILGPIQVGWTFTATSRTVLRPATMLWSCTNMDEFVASHQASLRGSAAEVRRIPVDKLRDLTTIERKLLESRFERQPPDLPL
ncbi:hypothetical protein AVEN_7758-1 [Araneus ventricosus]|uniref:Uncharacterized protein n=1 Tax=Araneus ventricosus TaxID=182803 RepID=A0A4Y2G3D9_ARAVE|nr:hypothetical protein AVEN_7758-1 [Araneus ventricosus]